MKTLRLALAAALVPLVVATAHAAVEVEFVESERYTDADLRHRGENESTIRELRAHLKRLGQRHLAPGHTLEIEILDVDLAGRFEWWHFPASDDVRYLREITWPRIALRWTLRDGETALREGEESVAERNYLWTSPQIRLSTDPFKYEKAMLDDWFRDRFGEDAP